MDNLEVVDEWSAGRYRGDENEDEDGGSSDISDISDDVIILSDDDDDDDVDMQVQLSSEEDDGAMLRDQPTTTRNKTTAVQGRIAADGHVTTAARHRPSTSANATTAPERLTTTTHATTAVRDGEKRRPACEFCGKTFTRNYTLKVHQRKYCHGRRMGNRQGSSAQVVSRSDQSVNAAGPSHASNNLDRTSTVDSPRLHFICPICRFDARSQFHLALHNLSHTDRNDIISDQGANIPLEPVRTSMDGSARDYEMLPNEAMSDAESWLRGRVSLVARLLSRMSAFRLRGMMYMRIRLVRLDESGKMCDSKLTTTVYTKSQGPQYHQQRDLECTVIYSHSLDQIHRV